MKMLTWTVAISVSENWVADGFQFDHNGAASLQEAILAYMLPNAYPHEVKVAVLTAPMPQEIDALQGE